MSGGAARRRGAREPLLLIHGLGAASRVWDPVVPLLSARARGDRARPARLRHRALAAARGRADRARHSPKRSATSSTPAASQRPARRRQQPRRLGRARTRTDRRGALGHLPLPRRPLAQADRPRRRGAPRDLGAAPAPAGGRSLSASRRCAAAPSPPSPPTPTNIPAAAGRELVLGWIDADGYDGANKAMREHIFDPAGYPPSEVPVTIAWAEHDQLVGPPKPERRPAGARFLVLPDVGHTPMWDDPELVARRILDGSGASRFRGDRRPAKEEQVDRREDREPAVAFERLPGRRQGARHRRPDRRQRRRRPADRHRRARRDHDHPLPRHPPARRPRRRGHRGARAGSAGRRWSPTRRPRRSSTRRSRS